MDSFLCVIVSTEELTHATFNATATYPRGDSHMKRSVMLVQSLRGKNQGFWYHLSCS